MNNNDVKRKGLFGLFCHGDSYTITWQNNYHSYSVTWQNNYGSYSVMDHPWYNNYRSYFVMVVIPSRYTGVLGMLCEKLWLLRCWVPSAPAQYSISAGVSTRPNGWLIEKSISLWADGFFQLIFIKLPICTLDIPTPYRCWLVPLYCKSNHTMISHHMRHANSKHHAIAIYSPM